MTKSQKCENITLVYRLLTFYALLCLRLDLWRNVLRKVVFVIFIPHDKS